MYEIGAVKYATSAYANVKATQHRTASTVFGLELTLMRDSLDLAFSTIFLQMSSLLSSVGALPRTNREALARVRATFIRRTSIMQGYIADANHNWYCTCLEGNRQSASLDQNEHKTG